MTTPSDYASLPHSSPEVQVLIDRHDRTPQTSASLGDDREDGAGRVPSQDERHPRLLLRRPRRRHQPRRVGVGVGVGGHSPCPPPGDVLPRPRDAHRFAHRIRDLADVPLLRDVASVATVRDLYTKSLLKVLSVAQLRPADAVGRVAWERAFAWILGDVYERHGSVLVRMARGTFELRAALGAAPRGSRHAERGTPQAAAGGRTPWSSRRWCRRTRSSTGSTSRGSGSASLSGSS